MPHACSAITAVLAGLGQRMNELASQLVARDKATPDGLRNHLRAEIDRWTPIIRKAGVYAE